MGESIDPDKLVSIAELAKEFGYAREHLSRLASEGKFRAWRVGGSWISTFDEVKQYVQTAPKPGRPKQRKKRVSKK